MESEHCEIMSYKLVSPVCFVAIKETILRFSRTVLGGNHPTVDALVRIVSVHLDGSDPEFLRLPPLP
jgi:hypothetical protein